MRKTIVALIIIAIILTIIPSSYALTTPPPSVKGNGFSLRNGITWYDSEETVLSKIQEEGLKYFEHDRTNIEATIPQEKSEKQIWSYTVENGISLGNPNEDVWMSVLGTHKTGLIELTYVITLRDGDINKRLTELKTSLEKKYAKLRYRKNYNNYKYVAWQNFDYATVTIYIDKDEPDRIYIMYISPDREEIMKSIKDGSFYISTPYGL